MCDPVSALLVTQAAVGAAGAISAGSAQASASRSNAAALETNATNRIEKAKFDIAQADRNYRRTAGKRDANIGSTGITADSFTDIAADDAAESALEKAAAMWSAQNDANMLRFQAESQRNQAKSAKTASYFNAAGAVLSAAGSYVKVQGLGVKAGGTFSPDTSEEAYGGLK